MASDSLLQFDDRRAYTLVRQFRFLVIHHNERALLCGIKVEMVELAMRMPSPLAPALEKYASLWRGCLQLQRRHNRGTKRRLEHHDFTAARSVVSGTNLSDWGEEEEI